MEFIPKFSIKKQLNFSRPTFNEPNVQLPECIEGKFRPPSSFADDEGDTTNDLSEAPKQTENINVYLRLRPAEHCASYKFNQNTVIIPQQAVNAEKHYKFTSVLNDRVSQVEIYDEIVRPILKEPFGIRGSTFASYGVSSSGKTYTILGDSSAGLVPRAITQIFTENKTAIAPYPCVKVVSDQISLLNDPNVELEMDAISDFLVESAKLNKGKVTNNWRHEEIINEHQFKEDVESEIDRLYIWISFVEIYNEKITDLLSYQRSTVRPLKIFSNGGHSYINGVTWLFAANIETALNILRHGLNRIKYAATALNDHSSRSHTILTINLISESEMGYKLSSFKFCDLAGAERSKKTKTVNERLKEAGGINTSLLVLGRCFEAVQQSQTKVNKKHPDPVIPVRDSKLTFLLQSSLQGHEKFVMIVNLYPTADFLDENLNVLKFGSIANQIVIRKSEARTFKRKSSRYSYNLPNMSLLNGSFGMNGTIDEGSDEELLNESELDDSFRWSRMNNEKLINELRLQKMFIEELKKKYHESETEAAKTRMQILESQKIIQERIVKRKDGDIEIIKNLYEKKMENQKIRYERELNNCFNEIDDLDRKYRKLKRQYGLMDSEEEEESEESDDEDVIEVE